MRVLLTSVVPALLTLFLGGGIVFWYDRYHPEATVFYDVESESIPLDDTHRQAMTKIVLRNASARNPATALNFRIAIETASAVRVGEIETSEPADEIVVTVTQPRQFYMDQAMEETRETLEEIRRRLERTRDAREESAKALEGSREALEQPPKAPLGETGSGPVIGKRVDEEAILAAESWTATISVRAPRLAPRSRIAIPVWWESGASGPFSSDVEVQGTADQCVIRPGAVPAEPWERERWIYSTPLVVSVLAALCYVIVSAAAWLRARHAKLRNR